MEINRIFLVWNADAGLRGHVHYAIEKFLRGNDECTLCEITHGNLGETREWKAAKEEIGLPVEAVYRNRLSDEQSRAVDGDLPCVLAETPDGLVKIVGSEAISGCAGDLSCFVDRLRSAIAV